MSRRRYGRVHAPDDRDKRFAVKKRASMRVSRTWTLGPRLDQLATPECVAFSAAGWLLSAPISQYLNPHGIYRYAKFDDEWRGEAYDGTSVRAGARVLAELGFISKYQWAFNVEAIIDTVLEVGPMMIGTNWYAGMATPDASNIMQPKGRLLGGHAYFLYSANTRSELFGVCGSYGTKWAKRGLTQLSFESMARLLGQDGEACIGVEAQPAFK